MEVENSAPARRAASSGEISLEDSLNEEERAVSDSDLQDYVKIEVNKYLYSKWLANLFAQKLDIWAQILQPSKFFNSKQKIRNKIKKIFLFQKLIEKLDKNYFCKCLIL